MWVCVCVYEREREREKERDTKRMKAKAKEEGTEIGKINTEKGNQKLMSLLINVLNNKKYITKNQKILKVLLICFNLK
jgi:hypothetical protein